KCAVANYSSGTAAVYHIGKDGKLSDACQVFKYGTADNPSHAHSAQFYKDDLFIADLGMNAVYQYQLKNDNYELETASIFNTTENTGPRHFDFTKDGKFIYIITEYGNT